VNQIVSEDFMNIINEENRLKINEEIKLLS
jgi:hypothetical protein